MIKESEIRKKISSQVKKLKGDQLQELLNYLLMLDNDEVDIEETLSFAGIWNELDDKIFSEFTTKLHQNREKNTTRRKGL